MIKRLLMVCLLVMGCCGLGYGQKEHVVVHLDRDSMELPNYLDKIVDTVIRVYDARYNIPVAVRINSEAVFSGATFSKEAYFYGPTFSKEADFSYTTFSKGTDFSFLKLSDSSSLFFIGCHLPDIIDFSHISPIKKGSCLKVVG